MKRIQELTKYAVSTLKPFEQKSVVEWAESNCVLSERITEQAGMYSTKSYPYVREVLENFANPKVKQISLCWGSQTSKTTTIYVGVGYTVDQKPSPVLMVYPTDAVVKTFSQDRLLPFFKDTQCLRDRMPKTSVGKIDTDRITTHRLEFDRCSINLVGGGSRANVRNYPVSILVLDEIDIIAEGSRREAMDRVKGRRNFKIIQASTPLEETTGIWGEYLSGDRRKYVMPCPHCLNEIIDLKAMETQERHKRQIAERKLRELELKKLEENWIPINEAKQVISKVTNVMHRLLENFPKRYAAIIDPTDADRVEQDLRDCVNETLTQFQVDME